MSALARDGATRREDATFLARCRAAADEWWKKQMRRGRGWKGPGLHPAHAMQAIGAAFGRDAIYVTDGGFTSLWAYWFLPPTRPRSYLSILELGMLGTGVPSALGAKLGSPGARGRVRHRRRRGRLPLHGDAVGGARAAEDHHHRLRRGLLDDGGAERADALRPNFGTEMGTVRWDVVAQGLGCEGLYAESLADVEPALATVRARADGPVVICVQTDRDANLGCRRIRCCASWRCTRARWAEVRLQGRSFLFPRKSGRTCKYLRSQNSGRLFE